MTYTPSQCSRVWHTWAAWSSFPGLLHSQTVLPHLSLTSTTALILFIFMALFVNVSWIHAFSLHYYEDSAALVPWIIPFMESHSWVDRFLGCSGRKHQLIPSCISNGSSRGYTITLPRKSTFIAVIWLVCILEDGWLWFKAEGFHDIFLEPWITWPTKCTRYWSLL